MSLPLLRTARYGNVTSLLVVTAMVVMLFTSIEQVRCDQCYTFAIVMYQPATEYNEEQTLNVTLSGTVTVSDTPSDPATCADPNSGGFAAPCYLITGLNGVRTATSTSESGVVTTSTQAITNNGTIDTAAASAPDDLLYPSMFPFINNNGITYDLNPPWNYLGKLWYQFNLYSQNGTNTINYEEADYATADNSAFTYNVTSATFTSGCASGVVGDPLFMGLRGQTFQVHGIDGEVYNLFTDSSYNVNARFVYLSATTSAQTPRQCPKVVAGQACWSHPGSYLDSIALVTSSGYRLTVKSGTAQAGFEYVTVTHNNNTNRLAIGQTYELSKSKDSVHYISSHLCTVRIGAFTLQIDNSDSFVNLNRVEWSRKTPLNTHGLLGQTHRYITHNSTLKWIEGEIDDYVVTDGLYGKDFIFNKMK